MVPKRLETGGTVQELGKVKTKIGNLCLLQFLYSRF